MLKTGEMFKKFYLFLIVRHLSKKSPQDLILFNILAFPQFLSIFLQKKVLKTGEMLESDYIF